MESVFLFKFVGNLLTPAEQKRLVEAFAPLVDIDRDYMDMVPVNVLVLIYNVWLFAETELIEILPGKDFKILIREPVIGMRIEIWRTGFFVLPIFGINALKFSAIAPIFILPSAGNTILLAPNIRPCSSFIFSPL